MKPCVSCKLAKTEAEMSNRYTCRLCKKEADRARYLLKKDKILSQSNAWKANNKERKRKTDAAYNKKFYAGNAEKESLLCKAWKENNPEAYKKSWIASDSKRRGVKYNTPKVLSALHKEELEAFIAKRPSGYEVDHIVPLQGKNVSGLHVPCNLQYLTKHENRVKKNKFTPIVEFF